MLSKFKLLSLILVIGLATLNLSSAELYKANTRLNLREAPSTSAVIVGVLMPDETVEVEEVVNDWAKIEISQGEFAYASAKYLSICESSESSGALVSEFHFTNKWVTPFLDGAGKNNLIAWIAIIILAVTLIIMNRNRTSMDKGPLIVTWFCSMASIASAFYFQDFGIDNFIVYILIMIMLTYVCYQEYLAYLMIMKNIFDDDDEGLKFGDCSFMISGIIGAITGTCAVMDWNIHSWVFTAIIIGIAVIAIRYFVSANNAYCVKESFAILPVVILANILIYIVGAIVFAIAIPLLITCLVIMAGSGSGKKDELRSGRHYVHLSNGTIIDNTESADHGYNQDGQPWHRKNPWSDEWLPGDY